MKEKIDLVQLDASFYQLQNRPQIVTIPAMKFLKISGTGTFLSENFFADLKFIYHLAIQMKLMKLWENCPKSYYDFRLMPIEVLTCKKEETEDYYEILIRQPEFMTEELFQKTLFIMSERLPKLFQEDQKNRVQLMEETEGDCIQISHFFNQCPSKIWRKLEKYVELKKLKMNLPSKSYCHQIFFHDLRHLDKKSFPILLRVPLITQI